MRTGWRARWCNNESNFVLWFITSRRASVRSARTDSHWVSVPVNCEGVFEWVLRTRRYFWVSKQFGQGQCPMNCARALGLHVSRFQFPDIQARLRGRRDDFSRPFSGFFAVSRKLGLGGVRIVSGCESPVALSVGESGLPHPFPSCCEVADGYQSNTFER